MAGMDYKALTWNEKGEKCEGTFTSPNNRTVIVYKDWLRLYLDPLDEELYLDLRSGELYYKDITILAVRDDYRNSLYFACWSRTNWTEETTVKGIAGIASYVWDATQDFPQDFLGIDQQQIAHFQQFLHPSKSALSYSAVYALPECLKTPIAITDEERSPW